MDLEIDFYIQNEIMKKTQSSIEVVSTVESLSHSKCQIAT